MRSLLLVLRIALLGMLAFLFSVAGGFSSDIRLAVALYLISFLCVFYLRRTLPKKPVTDWRAEAFTVGFIAIFPLIAWGIVGWVSIASSGHSTAQNAPPFEALQKTTGILKKGFGGNRYLVRQDKTTLRLICADKTTRGPDNWCLYGKEHPYLDKEVTVFHTRPSRTSNDFAFFYELRSGNKIVVPYTTTMSNLTEHKTVSAEHSLNLPVWLTFFWLYCLIDVWIRRPSAQKSPA